MQVVAQVADNIASHVDVRTTIRDVVQESILRRKFEMPKKALPLAWVHL